jgi:hypothetical protein
MPCIAARHASARPLAPTGPVYHRCHALLASWGKQRAWRAGLFKGTRTTLQDGHIARRALAKSAQSEEELEKQLQQQKVPRPAGDAHQALSPARTQLSRAVHTHTPAAAAPPQSACPVPYTSAPCTQLGS